MSTAGELADWWDSQRAETEKALEQLVDEHPNVLSVAAATFISTCMEVGAGTVDTMRLGKGMAEKGLAGAGEDAMRVLNMPVIGGGIVGKAVKGLGAGLKAAKPLIAKAASKFPKSAPAAIKECKFAKAIAAATQKVKSSLGLDGLSRPAANAEKCLTAGCPISMDTGEEILQLEDFQWNGPLPLRWVRTYRSSNSSRAGSLGYGWFTPLDERLERAGTEMVWHDAEGRRVYLPLPDVGGVAANPVEGLALAQSPDGTWRLRVEGQPDRLFQDGGGTLPLIGWINESGHRIDVRRDGQGRPVVLQSSWGRRLLLAWQGACLQSVTPVFDPDPAARPAKPWVRYVVDAAADLVAVHGRSDAGERYAYEGHMLVRRTLRSGFSFKFEWDRLSPAGRCVHNWGDGGIYDYRFQWEGGGLARVVDSRGGTSEYLHGPEGVLLRATTPEGRTTRYAYDSHLQLIRVTDGLGRVTVLERDDQGRLTGVVDAAGHRQTFELDEGGRVTARVDPSGHTWKQSFDKQGRIVRSEDPLGQVETVEYGPLGLPALVTNAAGQQRILLWDESARLVGEVGFDGLRTRYQHDAEDRIVAAVTQDRRTTRYVYDDAGRLVAVTDAKGATVGLAYDASDRLVRYTDACGATTHYRYDAGLSQLTERIDANGQSLRYHYDSERNLVGLTNARSERYGLAYDLDERLVEETGFDGRVQRYAYDAAGQLVRHAEFRGGQDPHAAWRVATLHRDPRGLLTRRTNGDGVETHFAYDAAGQLTEAGRPGSHLAFVYDAAGRLVIELQNGQAVQHRLDSLGRRVETQLPAGHRIGFRYDDDGHLQSLSWNGQALTRHQYDDLGQEAVRHQGALQSLYDYDPTGRLARHRVQARDGAKPTISRSYALDANGRVTGIDDARCGISRYVYDPADRLLGVDGVVPERFVHDPAGALLGSGDTGVGRVERGRLVMQGDRHLEYDAHGNLIEERFGTGGAQVQRYHYDADNRMVRAETAAGTSVYEYDALGRRHAKHTPQGTTRFAYDGPRLLVETVGDVDRCYAFEPESFRPLARIDAARSGNDDDGDDEEARVYYFQLDHRGLPQEMTDRQGRVVWAARCRAYGNLALALVQDIDNPIRLQGQYADAETGLSYNLHRYFHPVVGVFTQADPIGLAGGDDLYGLAPNPVNWLDPLGLSAKDCNAAAKGAGPTISRIVPGSLPAAEEAAAVSTLRHIDAGTKPAGDLAKKWGTQFKNWAGDLPGGQGAASPYREYRVAPSAGTTGAGTNRIVVNSQTGEVYYTWTHYGDTAKPAFVQVR